MRWSEGEREIDLERGEIRRERVRDLIDSRYTYRVRKREKIDSKYRLENEK